MSLKTLFRSRMVVTVIVLVVLTACGPSTAKTSGQAPVRSATAKSVVPTAHAAQVPSDIECTLITENDATSALGFDPGSGHIDKSGVLMDTDKMCAWGKPLSFNSKPFIDISAKKYASKGAAKADFGAKSALFVRTYKPGVVKTEAIGDGTVIAPVDDAATSYIILNEWVVMIVAYLPHTSVGDNTSHNHDVSKQLARVVVSRLK